MNAMNPQKTNDSKAVLNLGLNDGTYMPQACLDVLKSYSSRTDLRNYTTADNDPLREAIAEKDGVRPDQVFLRSGSGHILKQVVPWLIKKEIKSSTARIFRHLVSKNGFPIITPRLTYSKVPAKAAGLGLTVHLMPLTPESGFKLDPNHIEDCLRKKDGLVYIVNTKNPTGTVLITRDELEPLLQGYPRSRFWIDEAYVQYCDPSQHRPLSDLVSKYDNMLCSRTFSFAYGLAGLRMGYLLAPESSVAELNAQLVDYRFGTLKERMAMAAIGDAEHLEFLRNECAEQRKVLRDGMASFEGVETFESVTNFILCRFTDGRTASALYDAMMERGIRIKKFASYNGENFDEYFRLTLGVAEENQRLLQTLEQALSALK